MNQTNQLANGSFEGRPYECNNRLTTNTYSSSEFGAHTVVPLSEIGGSHNHAPTQSIVSSLSGGQPKPRRSTHDQYEAFNRASEDIDRESAPELELSEPTTRDEEPLIERPVSHGWRPNYLRRRVIVTLDIIFLIGIVVLEVLDTVSRRHGGLSDANQSLFYLWALFPATIITIILAFWARIEYQACRYIPWVILQNERQTQRSPAHKHENSSRTILLDYTNMWLPKAILCAIKNRHSVILSSILTSTILRILIILTSGLFATTLITFQHGGVPVDLLDQFSNHTPEMPDDFQYDLRPYTAERASWSVGLTYPNFTLPGIALQEFDVEKALGTVDNSTELSVIADGVSVSLDCESSNSTITTSTNPQYGALLAYRVPSNIQDTNLTGTLRVGNYIHADGYFLVYYSEDPVMETNSSRPLFMALVISSKWDDQSNTSHYDSTALVCTVAWSISKFIVTSKEGILSASDFPGSAKRGIGGALMDFLWRTEMSITTYGPSYIPFDFVSPQVDSVFIPDATDNATMVPFEVGMRLISERKVLISDLLDPFTLEQVMRLYHTHHGALIAHYDLRNATRGQTTGSVTEILNRVVVQSPICQAMVGLLGLAILLTLPLVWQTAPKDGFVPQEPRTLAGLAILLSKSGDFLNRLRGHGQSNMKIISEVVQGAYYTTVIHRAEIPLFPNFQICRLEHEISTENQKLPANKICTDVSWYQPWILHPASRTVAIIFTLGFLISLPVLLNLSITSHGIGIAINNELQHYLWTLIPSACFVGLSLYLSSCDFELRSLAPFVELRTTKSSSRGLFMSFIDEIGIRTFWNSTRGRHYTISASKTVVLLCGLLPIFTASLFSVETLDMVKEVQMQQDEWIASSNSGFDNSYLSGLAILTGNMSYPPWTYEDLAFPRISLADSSTLDSNSQIVAEIQAVRAVLNCSYFAGTTNFSFDINKEHYDCPSTSVPLCSGQQYPFALTLSIIPLTCNGRYLMSGIPTTAYAWGSCADVGEDTLMGPTSYTGVLVCDESFEQVNVSTRLFGPNLEIRESQPPVVNEGSAVHIPLEVNATSIYQLLSGAKAASMRSNFSPNGFFATLLTSRYAIPIEWLGDEGHKDDVIGAIKKQHGILRAQTISSGAGSRRRFDNTTTDPSFVQQKPPTRPPNTQADLYYAGRRVVQHSATTYVLITILVLVLLLNMLVIWRSEKEGYRHAIPKPPGSIAAVASLFADSTFIHNLPENSQWTSESRLEKHFQGKAFRMGWFARVDDDGERKFVYAIDAMEDQDFENDDLEMRDIE
ncbi:hypothetical protein M434DRAFT_388618 [Hypoxylon sp. CO27-5]|nr:hypothetical protein M434DRAFT_388618 [Hypoxylon sp. CO27-5]